MASLQYKHRLMLHCSLSSVRIHVAMYTSARLNMYKSNLTPILHYTKYTKDSRSCFLSPSLLLTRERISHLSPKKRALSRCQTNSPCSVIVIIMHLYTPSELLQRAPQGLERREIILNYHGERTHDIKSNKDIESNVPQCCSCLEHQFNLRQSSTQLWYQ